MTQTVQKTCFWEANDFWMFTLAGSMLVTVVLWFFLLVVNIVVVTGGMYLATLYQVMLWLVAIALVVLAMAFYKACSSQTAIGWRDVFFFVGIVLSLAMVVVSLFWNPLSLWVPYLTPFLGVVCAIVWVRSAYK